jgi:hypothetical protein
VGPSVQPALLLPVAGYLGSVLAEMRHSLLITTDCLRKDGSALRARGLTTFWSPQQFASNSFPPPSLAFIENHLAQEGVVHLTNGVLLNPDEWLFLLVKLMEVKFCFSKPWRYSLNLLCALINY